MSLILELFSCLTARARRILINQNKLPEPFIKFTFIKFKFLLLFPAYHCPSVLSLPKFLQPLVVTRAQPQSLFGFSPSLLDLAPAASSVAQPPLRAV